MVEFSSFVTSGQPSLLPRNLEGLHEIQHPVWDSRNWIWAQQLDVSVTLSNLEIAVFALGIQGAMSEAVRIWNVYPLDFPSLLWSLNFLLPNGQHHWHFWATSAKLPSSCATTAFWFSFWLTMDLLRGNWSRVSNHCWLSCWGLMVSGTLELVEGDCQVFLGH